MLIVEFLSTIYLNRKRISEELAKHLYFETNQFCNDKNAVKYDIPVRTTLK